MAYSAAELITRAYYLSGIVAQGQQTVSGVQMSIGFQLLNDMLAVMISDMSLIPFYQEYQTVSVVNQPDYFVPNLLAIETFTFNQGVGNPIRFATTNQGRKQFRGQSQVDNISTLPGTWHAERTIVDGVGGTTISIYPWPNDVYPLTVWGKFGLSSVPSKDTDLSQIYEAGYLVYLRYELASFICSDYGVSLAPSVMAQLNKYREDFDYISPVDLSVRKGSTLYSGRYPDFLAVAYLSNGWVPNGQV